MGRSVRMASVRTRTEGLRALGIAAAIVLLGLGGRARAIQLPSCGDGIVQPCAGSTACAQSVCNGAGSCLNVARDDGTACDDGNPCTTADQCVQGFCLAGPALDCDDENVCT